MRQPDQAASQPYSPNALQPNEGLENHSPSLPISQRLMLLSIPPVDRIHRSPKRSDRDGRSATLRLIPHEATTPHGALPASRPGVHPARPAPRWPVRPPEVGRAESGTDTLAGNRKGRPTRDGHTTPALVPLNRPGMSAMVFPPGISCSIPAEVPRRWPAAPFPVERATSWRSWQILTPALNRVGENENTPRADQPKLITQGVFESPAAS